MGRVLQDLVQGKGRDVGNGRFKIDTYASLPDDFTSNFSTKTFTSAGEATPSSSLVNGLYFSVQAIITAHSSIVGGTLVLQGSNIGGTADEVWADISSSVSIAGSDVGSSKFIAVSDKIKNYQYIRVKGDATSGSFTCYLLVYGMYPG